MPPIGVPFATAGSSAPLITTAPPNQGNLGLPFLDNILGTIPSLANAAGQVDATWGEIRDLGGNEEAPPQPTEKNLSGPGPSSGMGFAGVTAMGVAIGAVVAGLIWWAGGNVAWALVGGIAAAILSAWVTG